MVLGVSFLYPEVFKQRFNYPLDGDIGDRIYTAESHLHEVTFNIPLPIPATLRSYGHD